MKDRLAFVCQRVPFVSHVLVALAAWFGPLYAPTSYSLLFLAIHTLMLVTNAQSVYGVWAAVRGVQKQVQGRWRESSPASEDVESAGEGRLQEEDVEHVIIIPNYQEDIHTLQETLECLASHSRARLQYYVCLAMEGREEAADAKAYQLVKQYESYFKAMVYTLHPGGIEGEASGKASNVNWAARYIAASTSPALRARQIVTCIDSDILLAADFFERAGLIFSRATWEERGRMMFTMPIVFDRNAGDVPMGVAATDVMWSIAGLACTYPSATFKTPTSAYSVSMDLAIFVGFWTVGPEAIGEDYHMACKAFISTGGSLICHTIYSPSSVTDVVGASHGDGIRGWFSDLVARYKQAVRHLWGSLDTGYCLRRLLGPVASPDSDCSSASSPSFDALRPPSPPPSLSALSSEASDLSGDTMVGSGEPLKFKVSPPMGEDTRPPMPFFKMAALLSRCYQAHFLLVHFFIILTTPQVLRLFGRTSTCPLADAARWTPPVDVQSRWTLVRLADEMSHAFPSQGREFASCASRLAASAIALCEAIRFFRFLSTVICFTLYHFYRRRTIARWHRADALLRFGRRTGAVFAPSAWSIVNCVAIPFGVFFAIFPAIWAHSCHLFTNKLVYTTSFKPPKVLSAVGRAAVKAS